MSKPIVAGYDGTSEGRASLEMARQIATTADAPLHIVAAASDLLADVVATRAGLDLAGYHEALLRETDRSAREELADLLAAEPSRITLATRIGRPEHVLVEYATANDAALIVLGGHGPEDRGGRRDRGTAGHLLRRLSRPVLIASASTVRIERVLATLESAFAGRPVVDAARRYARLLDAGVEYLHVIDERAVHAAGRGGFRWSEPERELKLRAETDLWPLLEPAEARRIETGRVAETIARIASEGPPTLLVVGSHGKGWVERTLLGSVTEALLSDAPTALLVVPALPLEREHRKDGPSEPERP